MTTADYSTNCALAPDRGNLGRSAAAKLDGQRDHRWAHRKEAGADLSAVSQHDFADGQFDHFAGGLDQRARFPRESGEQAISGESLVGPNELVGPIGCDLRHDSTMRRAASCSIT